MMILLDAIIAGGIMYICKVDSVVDGLFITCMITFLRMSMKANNFINTLYQAAADVYLNKNENEEEI